MSIHPQPQISPEQETALVERARQGDSAAFGSLVEPWRGPLFGYIYRMVALRQDAEDLLQENRLYRQTALEQGDTALANVLDELERTLLDVAHSPQQPTAAQLEGIRQRIENRGILFKVRVVGKELQQREESGRTPAAPTGAKENGRKT